MIPCNNHIQIEPEEMSSFIASQKTSYEEVGRVVAVSAEIILIKPGDRVFFDSWQASKFPKDANGGFYWYVPFEAIKAYAPPESDKTE